MAWEDSNSKLEVVTVDDVDDGRRFDDSFMQIWELKIGYKAKFCFMTKLQHPNLHQTIVNTYLSINNSTSATVTTSTSFELATSHARVTSNKTTKEDGVSE